jgi:RNA polymerase-interacting CarD/CdnL/TRCF family regulator
MEWNVSFKQGDNVSGDIVSMGNYLGKEKIKSKEFHKIYDVCKKFILYLPLGEEKKLRKLPTRKTVLKNIDIFRTDDFVDYQKTDGSRYKFYKDKLAKASFQGSIEVLHDLCVLQRRKKLSVPEKKLWELLKEKLVFEISFILSCEQDKVKSMLVLNEIRA